MLSMLELQSEVKALYEKLVAMKSGLVPDITPQLDLSGCTSAGSSSITRPTPIKFTSSPSEYVAAVRADPYEGNDGLYGAGCRWPDLQHDDNDVQYGSYNTVECQGLDTPLVPLWHKSVTFSNRFTKTPNVIVWLTGADIRCDRPCHIQAYPADINEAGFILYIDSSEGAVRSAGLSWAAYTPDETKYFSNTFQMGIYSKCDKPAEYHYYDNSITGKALLVVNRLVWSGRGEHMPFVLKASPGLYDGYMWCKLVIENSSSVMYVLGVVYIICGRGGEGSA